MSSGGETSDPADESSEPPIALGSAFASCHGGVGHSEADNGAKDLGLERECASSRTFERRSLGNAEGALDDMDGEEEPDVGGRWRSLGRPEWRGHRGMNEAVVLREPEEEDEEEDEEDEEAGAPASLVRPVGESSRGASGVLEDYRWQHEEWDPASYEARGDAESSRSATDNDRRPILSSFRFPDGFDPGGGLRVFSPNQIIGQRQPLHGNNALPVLDANPLPGDLGGGLQQYMPLNHRTPFADSEQSLDIGGTASGEGRGGFAGNPNPHRLYYKAAGLRSFEMLHKRPKFFQPTALASRSKYRLNNKLFVAVAANASMGSSRRPFTESPSAGSSSPSGAGRLGSLAGGDQSNQPPSTAPLSSASHSTEGTKQENTGGDGDDGGPPVDAADVNDESVRMDLTYDLLHKVFSFLDDTSLCRAAMVCRQWRVASSHEDFWKVLNFEDRHVSHEQVGLLCGRYPRATTLNLKGAPCVDELLVRDAMRSLRNLEVLKLSRGFLSDGFFYALAVECSALRHLSISDALLGSGGAQEILLRHESMRHLQINRCRVLRIAIRCPQLEVLSLKRTGTASAVLQCPRLVNLDVSSCLKLSDAGVRAAVTSCPLLTTLDLSQCSYISDETLREISTVCTNLRTLDASYCPNISLEGVRMPMLVELKLLCCDGIISSSMAALSSCVMLEELQLDFCLFLTAISLDLPRLRQISLSSNRKLVELTLRSPSLTKLNLNICPILNRVDITSNSLLSLVLRQQNGLSSMALLCNKLREVDLSECENLTDAVCDVFSDGGGCPKLVTLILDNCEGLNNVRLSSSSLQSLSLVGCRNITSLKLVCGVLQQLQLDGCDHLTEASFAPIGLQSLNLGICPHLMTLWIEASQMTSLDLRGCGVLSRAVFHCPALLSLDASYCSQLGDNCLDETTSSCPAIQSLVLASCPSIGRLGLLALKRLKNLTMLDLSYTFLTDLSPIFEACSGVKVLRLSACKYLSETALDALHGGKVLPDLRELDLSYGSLGNAALEGVVALCPHLSHVSLNGCANVMDSLWTRLSSPPAATLQSGDCNWDVGMEDALSSIGVEGSLRDQSVDVRTTDEDFGVGDVNVCGEAVVEGEIVPMSVREDGHLGMKLGDQPSWSAPEHVTGFPSEQSSESEASTMMERANVRALQSLSCVGCPQINKVVIPRFAACFYLSSLNLSLCVNIREVQLACANLTSLNLSNCSGLVVLQLDCPRLISLHVQACGIETETLESAVQGCDTLETLDVRNCSKVFSASLARMRQVCPGLKRLYGNMSTQVL